MSRFPLGGRASWKRKSTIVETFIQTPKGKITYRAMHTADGRRWIREKIFDEVAKYSPEEVFGYVEGPSRYDYYWLFKVSIGKWGKRRLLKQRVDM